jgi:hypothetical protein
MDGAVVLSRFSYSCCEMTRQTDATNEQPPVNAPGTVFQQGQPAIFEYAERIMIDVKSFDDRLLYEDEPTLASGSYLGQAIK